MSLGHAEGTTEQQALIEAPGWLMDGLDSEFTCVVGRIVDCVPHPGADRLDLVTITISGGGEPFPYRLVVGKGDFRPDDLCVYVGPDSVVPLNSGGPFAFLSSRLDAKGKTEYRIRSARIRGLFSPGLVIPVPAGLNGRVSVGRAVSNELGVSPFVPGGEHPNVPGAAGSNAGAGPVPPPDRFPVYTVTALKKCPRLFEEGEPVVITEKIHGTNFRFGYGGGSRFYFGTHRTALADTRSTWRRLLDWFRGKKVRINRAPGFGDPWTEAVRKFELEDISTTFPELIFYGELFGVTGTGKRVQDLTYGQSDLQLRIFDCWHGTEKRWLTYDERARVMARMERLGVKPVAEIGPYEGRYSFDLVKKLAEEDSIYGGIREGVVIESLFGERRKAKWVSERYHMRKDG